MLQGGRLTVESTPQERAHSCARPPSSSPRPPTRRATSRRPTGSCAPPRATARSSSCCPRSGPCSAPADAARRRRAARRPGAELGARVARELASTSSPARSPSATRASDKLRNTCVHVGPDGEVRAVYRKMHLFDVEVDGATTASPTPRSRATRSSSRRPPTARGGPDHLLRPALPRALPRLARARRARCSPCPRRSRWRRRATTGRSLVRARAIENQGFVIAANQIGEHAPRPARPAGAR